MKTLAERDKMISELENQIKIHTKFLKGGIKKDNTNKEKLFELKEYLEHIMKKGGSVLNDLNTVSVLLSE